MRRVDVLFVNRFAWPDEAATARMLSDVAFGLAGEGLKVEVVSARLDYTGGVLKVPRREVEQGVVFQRLRTTRFGRACLWGRLLDYVSFYVSVAGWLAFHLPRVRTVVAKTDPPLLGVLVQWLASLYGVRVVQWSQDVFPEVAQVYFRSGLLRKTLGCLRGVRNAAWRASSRVVAIGQDMRRYWIAQGMVPERVACIPNWARGEAIRSVPHADNPLRRQWGFEGCFVLAYSGNFGRVHVSEGFIEAVQGLAERYPQLRFLFIGGGAGLKALRKEWPEGLRERVRFEDYQPVERLSESLSVADVHWFSLDPRCRDFVVPSKYYGILAAGRPMVFVGDMRSALAREIVEGGFGFAVEDARGFIEAVGWFIEERDCAAMGAQARRYFEANCDFPFRLAQWRALLRRS